MSDKVPTTAAGLRALLETASILGTEHHWPPVALKWADAAQALGEAQQAEIERLRARVAELERLRVERRDVLRDAVIAAYQQGAMDVHQNYQPDRSPDFTEAAYDYADAALAQQEGEG